LKFLFSTTDEIYGYTTRTVSNYYKFNVEWELTREYYYKGECVVTMVYGYDTDFVDEDYTWVISTKSRYQAALSNDNGNKTGSVKSVGDPWSKVEVTHKGKYITYSFWLNNSYSSLKATERESSYKD